MVTSNYNTLIARKLKARFSSYTKMQEETGLSYETVRSAIEGTVPISNRTKEIIIETALRVLTMQEKLELGLMQSVQESVVGTENFPIEALYEYPVVEGGDLYEEDKKIPKKEPSKVVRFDSQEGHTYSDGTTDKTLDKITPSLETPLSQQLYQLITKVLDLEKQVDLLKAKADKWDAIQDLLRD